MQSDSWKYLYRSFTTWCCQRKKPVRNLRHNSLWVIFKYFKWLHTRVLISVCDTPLVSVTHHWVGSLNFSFIPIFCTFKFLFVTPFFFELYITFVITVALVPCDSNNPKWECYQNSIKRWVKWCLQSFTLLSESNSCLYIYIYIYIFAVS